MRYAKIFVGRMALPRGFAVPLQTLSKIDPKNMRKTILYTLLAMMPACLRAGDFIEVMTASVSEARSGCSYSASVDIPVAGDGAVIHAAKLWICDAIGIDAPANIDNADFAALLRQGATEFLSDDTGTSRTVEITWAYEDPTCVTFTMHTTDRDSVLLDDRRCGLVQQDGRTPYHTRRDILLRRTTDQATHVDGPDGHRHAGTLGRRTVRGQRRIHRRMGACRRSGTTKQRHSLPAALRTDREKP